MRVVGEMDGQPVYGPDQIIYCAVCIYVRVGLSSPAVTVIEGYAVCELHMGRVAQGARFHAIMSPVTASQGTEP